MKPIPLFTIVLAFVSYTATAQDKSPLFQNEKPLPIRFNLSIRQIRSETNDSTYLPVQISYQNASGGWDSISSEMRTRGVFRKKNCHFPPLRVRFKKGANNKTVFDGNKSLKLVIPCQAGKEYNTLILKEYIGYKLYETISPYVFHTRLTDITFNEVNKGKSRSFQMRGFFIEDDDRLAKRMKGKIIEVTMHPLILNDTNAVRHDIFQFMIGNTDWSTTFQHNAKLLELSNRRVIPLAYDFDMSGVVNAPYATVDETLGISGPRDRIYRGYCRNNSGVLNVVRQEFLRAEPEMMQILKEYEAALGKGEFGSLQAFLLEFFDILKSDQEFNDRIVNACRK